MNISERVRKLVRDEYEGIPHTREQVLDGVIDALTIGPRSVYHELLFDEGVEEFHNSLDKEELAWYTVHENIPSDLVGNELALAVIENELTKLLAEMMVE